MSHLDEGTIHAWLDHALPDDEAARVEAHVRECAACADAVAEARGFIAAASRILSALDDVPAGVVPVPVERDLVVAETPALATTRPSLTVERGSGAAPRPRRWLRGPAYAAAAMLVLAVGSTLVLQRAGAPSGADARLEVRIDTPAPPASPSPIVATQPTAPGAPVKKSEVIDTRPLQLRSAGGAGAEARPSNSAPAPAGRRVAADEERAALRNETARQLADRADGPVTQRANEVRERKALGAEEKDKARDAVALRGQAAGASVKEDARAAAEPVRQAPKTLAFDSARRAVLDSMAPTLAMKRAAESPTPPPASAPVADSARRVVNGRVTAAGTGAPLAGASIFVPGQTTMTQTNAGGEFVLLVPRGEVTLQARAVGYAPEARSIPLGRDTVVFSLQQSVLSLSEVTVTGATGEARARPSAGFAAASSVAVAGCFDLDFSRYADQASARDLVQARVPARFRLDTARVVGAQTGRYRAAEIRDPLAGPSTTGTWLVRGDVVEITWTDGNRTRVEIATRSTPMVVTVADSTRAGTTRGQRPVATANRVLCP